MFGKIKTLLNRLSKAQPAPEPEPEVLTAARLNAFWRELNAEQFAHVSDPDVRAVLVDNDHSVGAVMFAMAATKDALAADMMAGDVEPTVLDRRADAFRAAERAMENGSLSDVIRDLRRVWL